MHGLEAANFRTTLTANQHGRDVTPLATLLLYKNFTRTFVTFNLSF